MEFDHVASLDFESRSRCNLRTHGALRYSLDPSTKVLLLSWRVDKGEVETWQPHLNPTIPARLLKLLRNPRVLKRAFNYSFERLIFLNVLGIDIPIEEWECTMALAFQRSLPGNLAELGEAINVDGAKKDKRGDKLINLFCKPRQARQIKADSPHEFNDWTTHPKEWEEFVQYNIQDVVAESKIANILLKFPIPAIEREIWLLDQHSNDEGMPINLEFVKTCWTMVQSERKRKIAQIESITGLANGNSPAQLLKWLQDSGYPFDDLTKEAVAEAVKLFSKSSYDSVIREHIWKRFKKDYGLDHAKDTRRNALKVLKLRQMAAKTSVNKYKQILDIQVDGKLRYCFQYGGAQRTLRWSGRKPQLQNLPSRFAKKWQKNLDHVRQLVMANDVEGILLFYGEPLDALVACIRTVIEAPEGQAIVCCDLSSIETRGIGEVSKCKPIFDTFEEGKDVYKVFASVLYKKPYEEITKAERDISKPPVLGSGFGLGPGEVTGTYPKLEYTGLVGYAKNMGVDMTVEQAEAGTKVFREELYPQVVDAWYAIQDAALRCIASKQPQQAKAKHPVTREWNAVQLDVWFDILGPFLRMRLPSGRHIHYLRPKVRETIVTIRRGPRKGETFVSQTISYEGYDDKKRWRRVDTRGAKFLENWAQAWARDIMAFHMLKAAKKGFKIIGTVHDELITLVAELKAPRAVKLLEAIMSTKPDWHKGILLSAEGFHSPWYRKN